MDGSSPIDDYLVVPEKVADRLLTKGPQVRLEGGVSSDLMLWSQISGTMADLKPSDFAKLGPENAYRSQKISTHARTPHSSLSRFDPAAASVALMASPRRPFRKHLCIR